MPRFFLDEAIGDTVTITGGDARHIALSLRMQVEDALTLCNGRGTDYACRITALSPDSVTLSVMETTASRSEPSVAVTLYQGLPKGDKLELIVQKAVELGVTRIVPVVTARSIARESARDQKKTARLQKIANEAAGQSGRGILPTVEPPVSFAAAAARMAGEHTVVLYECGGAPLRETVKDAPRTLSLFVGPEGGIAPDEVETLVKNGAKTATLGPRILRCETAPIAALAAVMALTGNMD